MHPLADRVLSLLATRAAQFIVRGALLLLAYLLGARWAMNHMPCEQLLVEVIAAALVTICGWLLDGWSHHRQRVKHDTLLIYGPRKN